MPVFVRGCQGRFDPALRGGRDPRRLTPGRGADREPRAEFQQGRAVFFADRADLKICGLGHAPSITFSSRLKKRSWQFPCEPNFNNKLPPTPATLSSKNDG